MKKCLLLKLLLTSFLSVCMLLVGKTRDARTVRDSLKRALSQSKADTNRVNLLLRLSQPDIYASPDTSLLYSLPALELARKLNFKKGEIWALINAGEALSMKEHYIKALEMKLEALQEAEKLNDVFWINRAQFNLAHEYLRTRDYQKALDIYYKAKANWSTQSIKYLFSIMGHCYVGLNNIDSAYHYVRQAYELELQDSEHWEHPYYFMGLIAEKKGNYAQALHFYRTAQPVTIVGSNQVGVGMASVFKELGRQDSAIHYAKKVVEKSLDHSSYEYLIDASEILTDIYKSNHAVDSAFEYQEIMLAAKDSLFSQEKVRFMENLKFEEQQRRQGVEQARERARQQYETRVKLYSLIAGLAGLSIIALILYRNNQHKQKAKVKIEEAYKELKATQAQFIQKEKMASLGELTAGIAHEIQNPLNFVNNFSEVNKELIEELVQANEEGNQPEVKTIATKLKENEDKIAHHGRRADSIVKGMLKHSRTAKGEKQPIDIDALIEEHLKLAYHGYRAKEKEFSVDFLTTYDSAIGKLHVVPQEIGRVLLNLFNNAFYAVQEKKKLLNGTYEPEVSVSTKKVNDKVEICIRDNGTGIPQKIIDKIYQPFFTTKPTGEGTGLGLSLSYDIITKGHGGELKVVTKEGEYAEFIVQLPQETATAIL